MSAELRLQVSGLQSSSPLGQSVATALAGLAEPWFENGSAPRGAWRRIARNTKLQWWAAGSAEPQGERPASVDIRVDLHGDAVGPGDWQIVDASGRPLLAAMQALTACYRAPYVASLFLVRRGSTGWELLGEAHLSSAVGYRALLGALGRSVGPMLRSAILNPVPSRAWAPGAGSPVGRGDRARAHLSAAWAWLRARAGGDIYGIALLARDGASLLHDQVVSAPKWTAIPTTEGFIADPFFWPGRPGIVLCEHYTHREGIGRLAALDFNNATLRPSPAFPPLTAGRHLSYPYAWADGERVVCLPEMAASRRQILYEIRDGEARVVCVVAEETAMADPTLWHEAGLYWIGYCDTDFGVADNLCLLYAERLEGPWHAHRGNPVKIDARSCRPGGTPFRVGGQLYRPAQDCARAYGTALVINAVQTCTPDAYVERQCAVLQPDPAGLYPDGIHTLALDNGKLLIDGKRESFHPVILWRKLSRRLPSVRLAAAEPIR